MGSSTADVAGAIYGLAAALGREVDPWTVARMAVDVEPTNGSLFPGVAVFDHREASLYKPLGTPPPADVLVLDCGGEVDTLEFNAIDRSAQLRELEQEFARALNLIRQGVDQQDLAALAQGSTISALAQQNLLPKAPLEQVIRVGHELGALGVTVAHSGTVIGVIFPPGVKESEIEKENSSISSRLVARVSGVTSVGWFPLTAGGLQTTPRTLVTPNL
jgi:L-threonine kinase